MSHTTNRERPHPIACSSCGRFVDYMRVKSNQNGNQGRLVAKVINLFSPKPTTEIKATVLQLESIYWPALQLLELEPRQSFIPAVTFSSSAGL